MITTAKKTHANLSLRADLVARAKKLRVNLSELLEQALEARLAEAERDHWLDENREAIDGYNARVAKRGVFSDGRRRF
jgi:antitoxin CcdA